MLTNVTYPTFFVIIQFFYILKYFFKIDVLFYEIFKIIKIIRIYLKKNLERSEREIRLDRKSL